MRILKYILLLIILTAVSGSVYVFTQDGIYSVSSETEIDVPEKRVYQYIKDIRNWGSFCFSDSTAASVFECSHDLTAQKCTGTGNIKSIEALSVSKDSLAQNILWFDKHESTSFWSFESSENNKTNITWRIQGELNFFQKLKKIITGGIPTEIKKIQTAALKNLGKVLVEELNFYEITENGVVTLQEIHYLQIKAETDIPGFYPKVSLLLAYLEDFFNENKIERAGSPMVIFDSYSENKNEVIFSVCIPTKEDIFTTPESEITESLRKAYSAAKVTWRGDYMHSKKAWDAAFAYIEKNRLEIDDAGYFSEIYVVNENTKQKPSEWITEIYIPVKSDGIKTSAATESEEFIGDN